MSGKITGFGGIFIRSKDKQRLMDWYRNTLELNLEDWGALLPVNQINPQESQVFSIFPQESDYMHKGQSFMINWMVSDLDSFYNKLKEKNTIVSSIQVNEFGKFMWLDDCEGNKLELWEPPVIS